MLKKLNYLDFSNSINASIEKIVDEKSRCPEHDKLVSNFLIVDAIASGVEKDFQFVLKIPEMIESIIEEKKWEKFYVAKGVSQAYYCGYTKGNDIENFKNFVEAKRPNGLGTNLETIDLLLALNPPIREKYRKFLKWI